MTPRYRHELRPSTQQSQQPQQQPNNNTSQMERRVDWYDITIKYLIFDLGLNKVVRRSSAATFATSLASAAVGTLVKTDTLTFPTDSFTSHHFIWHFAVFLKFFATLSLSFSLFHSLVIKFDQSSVSYDRTCLMNYCKHVIKQVSLLQC
jgi:hypothetical protein